LDDGRVVIVVSSWSSYNYLETAQESTRVGLDVVVT
jgi:hypothetical protein